MNATIRRIAVSGSAAVALLGGTAAITVMDAPQASAAEIQAAVDRATGAPVNLPDGRVMHVRGLDNVSYKADAGHHTATVQLAANNPGSGFNPQTPVTGQTPADYQQIQAQTAGGGTLAVGIVVILVLGIIVFFKVKHGHIKAMDATLVGLLGISLAGTIVGSMGSSLTNSLVGSLGSALGGLG